MPQPAEVAAAALLEAAAAAAAERAAEAAAGASFFSSPGGKDLVVLFGMVAEAAMDETCTVGCSGKLR